jgi:NADPH-dependent F420 reductase
MRPTPVAALLLIASALCSGNVVAETIAIIGTGNVASSLGPKFAAQGHTVVYGSRKPDSGNAQELVRETGNNASVTTPSNSVREAGIVVLAVPGTRAKEIVMGLGDLADKIIIDPTNPMERKLMTFHHAVDTSNAQIIQELQPDADVVKAFNTLSWKTMKDADGAGGPVSVPLAGNSRSAKKVVAELASGMGLEPIDVGGVESAHWVEGMLILWINNRFSTRDSFDFYLRKAE